MPATVVLADGVTLRPLASDDVAPLASAYLRNAGHLAPWEPVRPDGFATEAVQRQSVELRLAQAEAGRAVTLVLSRPEPENGPAPDEVVGMLTIAGITRGAFQSGDLGYWIDRRLQGRGLMAAAVEAVVAIARDELGLHRLQAGTLPENDRSQRVLLRAGFERIGYAPSYLKIAGRWRDHVLFQRILHDGP